MSQVHLVLYFNAISRASTSALARPISFPSPCTKHLRCFRHRDTQRSFPPRAILLVRKSCETKSSRKPPNVRSCWLSSVTRFQKSLVLISLNLDISINWHISNGNFRIGTMKMILRPSALHLFFFFSFFSLNLSTTDDRARANLARAFANEIGKVTTRSTKIRSRIADGSCTRWQKSSNSPQRRSSINVRASFETNSRLLKRIHPDRRTNVSFGVVQKSRSICPSRRDNYTEFTLQIYERYVLLRGKYAKWIDRAQ